MCDTTGEGFQSAADSNVTTKKRATLRAENFVLARGGPAEDYVFHSSHLIWAEKAE